MELFIGIDVGRKLTKWTTGDQVGHFPSRVGDARELRIGDYGNYIVTINGHRYFVGQMAEESYSRREMATESKLHPETQVLFLTALALANPTAMPAVVVTGLPVTQHHDATKEALSRLLKGRHMIQMGDGSTRIHDVQDVVIVPEGAATFWDMALTSEGRKARPDLLEAERVLVLDIGSRTVNYVTVTGGRYLDRDSGTLSYGARELDVAGDTDDNRKQFARRVLADISERVAQLGDTRLCILSGGGSKKVGTYLQGHFQRVEFPGDPITANVSGFRKLGVLRERQRQAKR